MVADGYLELSGSDVLVAASIGLILIAFAVWRLYYVQRQSTEDIELTDGAVLLLSDGMVQQASSSAHALLGSCTNAPVVRVLDDFLGPDASDARDAVNRLEMTGDPVDMLVRTPDGTPYELIGQPAGALIRLVLRDARLLDDTLRNAEAKIEAADTALNQHDWAQQTLMGLIGEAPIIAWHRTAQGEINWSDGMIRGRSGAVSADQAVDLIVARTKLNRQPVLAGQPQKSRIEIVVNEGAETVSLHVIEIVRQDGSRIGFATDAGTAASAERTLTRFVQTMTETFAHLTVGLAIFDRNQTLALFNPALVQMWQVEPAWLARRPSLRDIIDELRATRRLPELQDFHKWRSRLIDLFENTEAADYEELWHLADGSNIRVLARPHPHGSLAFIFDDVTERMRLEQRYRHSIDLRRATLDRLTEGIAVFGANGLLQFVNQAFHEIWGTDSETVYAAMHARQLVTLCEEMTMEPEIWHRLHGYITGEENRRAWTARLTMAGNRILTARFAPLPDGSTMAVFSDITESERIAMALTEQNEALEMADGMRTEVLEKMTYKLREPLALALDQARRLQDSDVSDDDMRRDIAGVVESATTALAVMTDITDLTSLLPIGPSDGEESTIVLFDLLEFAQRVLSQRATAAGIVMTLEDDLDAEAEITCYKMRMRQIAFQLLAESIKNTTDGGTVVIGGEGTGPSFSLYTIVDAAPGLAPGTSNRARFQMSVVHTLVASVGGSVNLEVQADDRVRITCTFGPRLLPGETVEVPEEPSNIHPLLPRSG